MMIKQYCSFDNKFYEITYRYVRSKLILIVIDNDLKESKRLYSTIL